MIYRQALWIMLLAVAGHLAAGQGGFVAGVVRDRSGGPVAGAEVRVQSEATGARQKVYCDPAGLYMTSELAAGNYRVTVRRDGFRTVTRPDIAVTGGKQTMVDVTIELLPLQQEITVVASQSSEDPLVSGVTVSRDSPGASTPANGHDVHAILSLMPGATMTPASLTSGGQFTVGGQRPNTNSFRVDGASGNVGLGIISIPGAFPGDSLPGMTTIGGMQNFASSEETERVELHSADFALEYGDRPGAQIAIDTRSGTNEFHGSALGYLRPHALDSSDWFARGAAANLPSPALNGWGGGLGGPIWRNHTFFFASFERTSVHDNALQIIPVASAAGRAAAGAPYQLILDAFPQPVGRALNAYESVGYLPLQKTAAITNSSFRLDQSFGKWAQFFARYAFVPSSSTSIELGSAYSRFNWESATAGLNTATGNVTQAARFNYTRVYAVAQHGPHDTQALTALQKAITEIAVQLQAEPLSYNYYYLGTGSVTQVSMAGEGQAITGQSGDSNQLQVAASYAAHIRLHKQDIQAGGSFTLLQPNSNSLVSSLAVAVPDIASLIQGVPLGLTQAMFIAAEKPIDKWSYFGQDTVHLGTNLDLLFGARWEFTHSPFSFYPGAPTYYSYLGYWRGVGAGLPAAMSGSVYAPTTTLPRRYTQIAPRLALAYRSPLAGVVMRAGAGVFYDTGAGSIVSNENPLSIWQYLPSTQNPNMNSTPAADYPTILYLPQVLEWRASLEKTLADQALFSLTYSGSQGRNLLRDEATVDPNTNVINTIGFTSHGRSTYQALLAQFHGNLSPSFYFSAAYTWSHSIDTGSSDTALELVQPGVSTLADKGSSAFDIRHLLLASLSYRLPESKFAPRFRPVLGKWTISSTLFARTGFPFDVTTVDRSNGFGFDNSGRADLVKGQPLWLNDPSAPGGRVLNPAAFGTPADGQNGTLGRNSLTGPGIFQIDLSLRRQFRLFRNTSLEASASAYNLANHPAFSNPVSYLGSALFGQSTSTANLMLGTGSPTTGLTPLFQAGGARTVELGLRFTF